MSKRDVTYDPTDIQLQALGSMQNQDYGIEDLTSPEVVYLLIQQQITTLYQLKAQNADIESLREKNNSLQEERENLRVKLAKANVSGSVVLAEILISYLGGFAVNILTNNWRDGLGWVIFILSMLIIISFRTPKLSSAIEKTFGKEE